MLGLLYAGSLICPGSYINKLLYTVTRFIQFGRAFLCHYIVKEIAAPNHALELRSGIAQK